MDQHYPPLPDTIRSRVMLEVASELVGLPRAAFPTRQVSVHFRRQGERSEMLHFFGSDGPAELERVARRELDVAIVNPSVLLTLAYRGVSPFRGPLPLRTIAVIPSWDQLVLAVTADAGIGFVEDLATFDRPLRISLRGQKSHSLHTVVDHVLQASGTSLADLRANGTTIYYDDGLPTMGRLDSVRAGERDAIFDEAANTWAEETAGAGLRILDLRQETIARLESWGYRHSLIEPGAYPSLDRVSNTVDFSGFPIYVHEEADSTFVQLFCSALEARREAIQLQDGSALPLADICRNTREAPFDVPLHDAARAYWTSRGYL